ncbi:hypothetical protein AB9F45_36325, partial [Rhizobium leguminosarum]
LGFATHGEISAFWNLVSPDEAKVWLSAHRDELIEVLIEPALGGKARPSWAFADFLSTLYTYPGAPPRIRVLSPCDPLQLRFQPLQPPGR